MVIPPHHELRKRTARRNDEMGSPVPLEAINAMKGGEQRGEWGLVGGGRDGSEPWLHCCTK